MARDLNWKQWLNKLVYWTAAHLAVYNTVMSVRFWDRVDRSGGPDGCWLWKGSSAKSGYGWFWWAGKNRRAHRVAWELTHGPTDQHVLHDCDNQRCVNPKHLFLGSHADNMRDKANKGRQSKGEDVNTSKLTESDVVSIRTRYAGGESQSLLAREFGVVPAQLSKIIRGVDWKHVGGPVGSRGREVQTAPGSNGKLTEKQVLRIRAAADAGASQASLARKYSVTDACISRIVLRKTWRHL